MIEIIWKISGSFIFPEEISANMIQQKFII